MGTLKKLNISKIRSHVVYPAYSDLPESKEKEGGTVNTEIKVVRLEGSNNELSISQIINWLRI